MNSFSKKFFTAVVIISASLYTYAQEPSANKISFASKPFSTSPSTQTEFKASSAIYGQLVLEKPLKDYCEPLEKSLQDYYKVDKSIVRMLSFEVFIKNSDGEYTKASQLRAQLCLTQNDIESNIINFDITPAQGTATTVYPMGSSFWWILASQYDMPLGNKNDLKVVLDAEYNTMISSVNVSAAGELVIDYTASTEATQKQWWQACEDEGANAKANGLLKANAEGAEFAKTLPLPSCFKKTGNPGYTAYSNAKIIEMLKQKYKTTQIFNLTFDVVDGQGDFRSLVDASTNTPTYKMGNHVFYFAFKDKDGTYRFSGGVLKMDYEGYGKYSEVYVQNYSPIMGDEKYPYDKVRDSEGIYSVFLFDGAKLK